MMNNINSNENAQKKVSQGIISEKFEAENILFDTSFQKYDINKLKDEYIESILKSRQVYLNQHLNNPGFYSLVVIYQNKFENDQPCRFLWNFPLISSSKR